MSGKKTIFCVFLALLSVKVFPQAMTLDEAIKTTATELGQRINTNRIPNISSSNQSIGQTAEEIRRQLTAQTKIAVLNFSSDWQELSTYVIDELNTAIGREGSLAVVNKQQLDLVRQELVFQESGDVSDESQQSKGKFLGAQAVLTGSFTVIGKNMYRFRVRAITVETAVELYSNSIDIKNDKVLTALMQKAAGSNNIGASNFGRNIGYGFLNPIFGLGSYIQGDPLAGGLPLTLAYIASGILIIVEVAAYDYWDDNAGVCGTIGLGIAAPALIYGFIRPFVYSRNSRTAQALDGLRLGIVPTADDGIGIGIGYSIKF
jgi:hypothetical protein